VEAGFARAAKLQNKNMILGSYVVSVVRSTYLDFFKSCDFIYFVQINYGLENGLAFPS
jgi:hypothetical protein